MSRATDLLLESAMSALVHYRTSWLHEKASALPLKPDILRADETASYVPAAVL